MDTITHYFIFGLVAVACLMAVVFIRLITPIAIQVGLTDKPDGRKHHETPTPLVGGVAIYFSVLVSGLLLYINDVEGVNLAFIAVGGVLVLIGLLDDHFEVSVRIRMLIQAFASLVMIYGAEVVLLDLGAIVSSELLVLGILAVPFTILGVIGTTNALNMVDGIDGLAGALSFVCLALLLSVAVVSGHNSEVILIAITMGGILGFLLFNFHWFGIRNAHVFMGDAGSMMLGFLFAWLLISLSQGDDRAIQPVTALWIFAVPLMDSVGIIMRRLWLRRSPFKADRGHLHHLLLDAGFRVRQAVLLIAILQGVLGLIGLAGLYFHVPEKYMFASFLSLFAIYCYFLLRPWRAVPKLRYIHKSLKLTVHGCDQIYIGNLEMASAVNDIQRIIDSMGTDYVYRIYESRARNSDKCLFFAVIDIDMTDNMTKVCRQFSRSEFFKSGFVVRRFIRRNPENDRRKVVKERGISVRVCDRRSSSVLEMVPPADWAVSSPNNITSTLRT